MFLRCCWRMLRGSICPWSTKASLHNLQHCWRSKRELVEIAWSCCWNTFLWLLDDIKRKEENLGPLTVSIHCMDLPGTVLKSRRQPCYWATKFRLCGAALGCCCFTALHTMNCDTAWQRWSPVASCALQSQATSWAPGCQHNAFVLPFFQEFCQCIKGSSCSHHLLLQLHLQ